MKRKTRSKAKLFVADRPDRLAGGVGGGPDICTWSKRGIVRSESMNPASKFHLEKTKNMAIAKYHVSVPEFYPSGLNSLILFKTWLR